MRVIGTAGHVDHGKSTLVQALTGTHPDRLKEEREREMTIDLGFAFLTLPNGEEVGIVDVPGHRDFIENMLAGVGGIDAALFVVAADEGVMPQTAEHLAILNLLKIPGGVIALTKIDMVDDPDWLDLVEHELRQKMSGTAFAEAPIVRVSARRGDRIPDLADEIARALGDRPSRPDVARPRLPVDRVFSMPGFGTVVTGTLSDGRLQVGDEVEIYPTGIRGRVRGLQSHNRKEESAQPGSRTAVNISGVNHDQIQRGNWIGHPGQFEATWRLDVQLELLPGVSLPLKHNSEVKFFIGAAETIGRVRVLGNESITGGETGWAQIELRAPVIAVRGDRFVIRRPSPGETIGGGAVVDPHPARRHRRFAPAVLERLAALAGGTVEEVVLQAIQSVGAGTAREIASQSGLEGGQALAVLQQLRERGALWVPDDEEISLAGSAVITTRSYAETWEARLLTLVAQFHLQNPLRRGVPREELKGRLAAAPPFFNALLNRNVVEGKLVHEKGLVWEAGHQLKFSSAQKLDIQHLLDSFAANPYAPPSVKQAQEAVGEAVYAVLLETDQLIQVSPEVVFRTMDYAAMLAETRKMIEQEGHVSVASFRDRFQTSRKYALGFLEYLDAKGVTARDGDLRRLR